MIQTSVKRHLRRGRPVKRHVRVIIPKPPLKFKRGVAWTLPTPYYTAVGRDSEGGVIDPETANLETYPVTESRGGNFSDDPTFAAFQAKDIYWEEADSRREIMRLVRRIENGLPIDPIEANVDARTGRVDNFNGGHRLRAAAIAGLKTIPIAVNWVDEAGVLARPARPPRIQWIT